MKMNARVLAVLVGLGVLAPVWPPAGCGIVAPARAQVAYKDTAGPYSVEQRDETWKDAARNREVPVRILMPRVKADGEAGGRPGKFPVVVFSHGLGGSRNVGAYITEHLASHGYIVIAPTHHGSDTEAVREELRERVKRRVERGRKEKDDPMGFLKDNTSDPDNLKNRPADVSFVIDQLSKDEKLAPVADVEHVGVGGHSFGAYTTFAVAGMTIDLPDGGAKGVSFRDPRVKAGVAMSPQGAGAMGITASSWDTMAAPVLSLTGTKDYGQGERAAAWRREGFDTTRSAAAMLVVIRDAAHGTFSDFAGSKRTGGEGPGKDHAQHIRYTKMVTTAYFDAYVRGDQSALAWLAERELAKFDEGACEVAFKSGKNAEPKGGTKSTERK